MNKVSQALSLFSKLSDDSKNLVVKSLEEMLDEGPPTEPTAIGSIESPYNAQRLMFMYLQNVVKVALTMLVFMI